MAQLAEQVRTGSADARAPSCGEAATVLIVDDEPVVRSLCRDLVTSMGLSAETAADGVEALAVLKRKTIHLVLLDLRLPRMPGIQVLRAIKRAQPAVEVIVITGYGDIEVAVEAMKLGAADFLTKPFAPERLRESILSMSSAPSQCPMRNAQCAVSFTDELRTGELRTGLPEPHDLIVGASPAMRRLFDTLARVCPTDATVLIQGESGTGKELIARALHFNGPRAAQPFIPVDCGAINPNLMASELFGHVKGAYTGAHTTTPGLLRIAGHGAAFLDEVSEIPLGVQATLLRALQEMEVRPVGGHRVEPFHARIIAATNCDLERALAEGRFRQDLYYRLNVVRIDVPPLRERREDIPLLVEYFLRRLGSERKGVKPITTRRRCRAVSPAAMQALCDCHWPGNVRELENVIERVFTFARGDEIDVDDLPPEVATAGHPPGVSAERKGSLTLVGSSRPRASSFPGAEVREHLPAERSRQVRSMPEAERDAIAAALAHTGGNKRQAARLLKIGIATLYRKLERYGLASA